MVMFDKLVIINYNTQKQKKIKTEPGIKLNHNIDTQLDLGKGRRPHLIFNH